MIALASAVSPPNMLDFAHGHGMTGVAVAAIVILGAMALFDDPRAAVRRRLSRVTGQRSAAATTPNRHNAMRRSDDSSIALLNQIIRLLPHPDKLRQRLARMGSKLTLAEYVLINVITAVASYAVARMVGCAAPLSLTLAVMLGFGVPHLVTGMLGGRRIKKFLALFAEAIDTLCRGLRSGLPVTESIAAVGREMPDPVGFEFSQIADGVRIGKTLDQAMGEVARRIDAPEYRFLMIAMAIQKETGGNLAETLGHLADLIRRRRQLRLKIKAMSAEAFASALIIGSLPFVMFILLTLVSPDYVRPLFNSTGGRILLGVACGWMSVGWGVMIKMIHFEL